MAADNERIAADLRDRPDGEALLERAQRAGKDFETVLATLVHLHVRVPALAERLVMMIEESCATFRAEQAKEN